MPDFAQIRARLAAAVGGEARLAANFAARIMSDTNQRAARELDSAAQDCVQLLERVAQALAKSAFADYRQSSEEELIAGYARRWSAYQAAGARTMSWMVTGPARFPVDRNRKRMDTEHKRLNELVDWWKAAPAQEVKRARLAQAAAIGAGGLAAVELAELERNLATRETRQAMMRAVNAQIRKARLGEGDGEALAAWCQAAGYPINAATATRLLEPPAWGQRGFADYQLRNNNAEIRRLQGRVAQVRAKLERIDTAELAAAKVEEIAGVQIREDVADDRLRLIFPDKPDAATRAALKGRGFRWSPMAGAWQRQLTQAARDAARAILGQLQPA